MRVPMDAVEVCEDELARLDGQIFTGVVYEMDTDGQLKSETEYRSGLQTGVGRDYFANGKVCVETMFRRGSKHGRERKWREDGSLIYEATFEFSIQVECRTWDANGQQISHSKIDINSDQFRTLELFRKAT